MSACSSARASAGSPRSSASTRPTSRAARARSRRSSFPAPSSTSRPGRSRFASAPRGRTRRRARRARRRRTRVGDAFEIIRRGAADAMIAGGAEAAVCAMGVGGFGALRALSTRNDDPATASRPFDKRSRRLRARRRRRHADPRGARVRPASRRANLRRDGRLRHVGRRLSHDGAVRRRRRRVSRDAGGASSRQASSRRTSTTSTRTARRRRTTIASRRTPSSATFGDHAPQAGRVVDQVDDRPPARRRRRARGRHHRAGRASPASAADDQPRRIPTRGSTSTTCPTPSREMPIRYALSNSFGFGGTNGALLFKKFEE